MKKVCTGRPSIAWNAHGVLRAREDQRDLLDLLALDVRHGDPLPIPVLPRASRSSSCFFRHRQVLLLDQSGRHRLLQDLARISAFVVPVRVSTISAESISSLDHAGMSGMHSSWDRPTRNLLYRRGSRLDFFSGSAISSTAGSASATSGLPDAALAGIRLVDAVLSVLLVLLVAGARSSRRPGPPVSRTCSPAAWPRTRGRCRSARPSRRTFPDLQRVEHHVHPREPVVEPTELRDLGLGIGPEPV
jgi:hypothetical protein